MKYLSYIDNSYTTKNSLEQAIAEFLQENNRVEISADHIVQFKEFITAGIARLNAFHSRCKPVVVRWNSGYSNLPGDHYLGTGHRICRFCIFQSRKEFINE